MCVVRRAMAAARLQMVCHAGQELRHVRHARVAHLSETIHPSAKSAVNIAALAKGAMARRPCWMTVHWSVLIWLVPASILADVSRCNTCLMSAHVAAVTQRTGSCGAGQAGRGLLLRWLRCGE